MKTVVMIVSLPIFLVGMVLLVIGACLSFPFCYAVGNGDCISKILNFKLEDVE